MSFIRTDTGALCPKHLDGMDPFHRLYVMLTDRLYNALPTDEDGELTEEADAIYREVARPVDGCMWLYRQAWTDTKGGLNQHGVAHFYRCPICGFVLPIT